MNSLNNVLDFSNLFCPLHLALGQVLSIMEAIDLVSPPLKCVSLTLDAGINLLVPSKIVLPGIANLLGNSPNLETLVITMTSICDSEVRFIYHLVTYLFELSDEMGELINMPLTLIS